MRANAHNALTWSFFASWHRMNHGNVRTRYENVALFLVRFQQVQSCFR